MKRLSTPKSFLPKSLPRLSHWGMGAFGISVCCAATLTLIIGVMGGWRLHQRPGQVVLPVAGTDPTRAAAIHEAFGKLPLSFTAASDAAGQFVARGAGYQLAVNSHQMLMQLNQSRQSALQPFRHAKATPQAASVKLSMELVNANPTAPAQSIDPQPGQINYLLGNDPTKWQRNVPNFGRIRYQDVYPNIDLVYYGNQRQLEYDFIVKPGADPNQIRLKFAGAEQVSINEQGDCRCARRGAKSASTSQ